MDVFSPLNFVEPHAQSLSIKLDNFRASMSSSKYIENEVDNIPLNHILHIIRYRLLLCSQTAHCQQKYRIYIIVSMVPVLFKHV